MSFQLSLSTEPVTTAYPAEPLLIKPESTVGEVLQLLRAQRTGCVLICAACEGQGCEELVGIFT